MRHFIALTGFVLLAGCCSDALAADEFGSRFGSSSPYALQNTIGNAAKDVSGMGPEDLNTITPAAGAESDPEAASDAEVMEGMGAHAGPDTPPQMAPAAGSGAIDDISP